MWEILAESRIQEALASGEFENLAGAGQPLDLDAYFAMPPGFRMGYSILKNAGEVPPEVENLRAIAALERDLECEQNTKRREALRERLETHRVTFRIRMEKRRGDR